MAELPADMGFVLQASAAWETVYQNRYHRVVRVVSAATGRKKEYFVTDYGPRSGVLVLRGEEVLLVRQYRLLLDRISLEIPGGKAESGESPEEAAVRECREETGIHCLNLRPLIRFHTGTDTLFNPTAVFHTRDFTDDGAGDAASEQHEVEGHVWMPLTTCLEMVFNQEIVDGLSVTALLAFHAQGYADADRSGPARESLPRKGP